MKLIKVKFLKDGNPSGRGYTYFSPEEVVVGDEVQINESAKGIVIEINVPEEEIESYKDKVKTIIGKVVEQWKIVNICNSDDGTTRTDGRYPLRIGRICKRPEAQDMIPMVIDYLKNADGSDYSNYSLRTSRVVSIEESSNHIKISTLNSIYEFEKVEGK